MTLFPITAQQLRSYSLEGEITQLYFKIIEVAKLGCIYMDFDIKSNHSIYIIEYLRRLFPDTKILELHKYRHITTYRITWHEDLSGQPQYPLLPVLK
jgi:hypothetical protein